MNPLAKDAVKKAYSIIEAINDDSEVHQTSERRKYMLGVFNTLCIVGLINKDEYTRLTKQMEKKLPYY